MHFHVVYQLHVYQFLTGVYIYNREIISYFVQDIKKSWNTSIEIATAVHAMLH